MATQKSVYVVVPLLVLVGLVSVAMARTWTSRDGKFTTEATLLDFKDGKVKLKKDDGGVIEIPLSKFCEKDQEFVKGRFSKSEKEPAQLGPEYREWKSRDGKFTIKARLLDSSRGKVRLRTADGREIDVPLGKLGSKDKSWVRREMRRRERSGQTGTEQTDTPEEEEEGETDWAAETTPGEDDEITESLGLQNVEMKLVRLKLPSGRKKKPDPLTQYLLQMTNPQSFSLFGLGNGRKNPNEDRFRKVVKKEPKYTMKKPFRAVAKFGSKDYAFALDAVGKKPKGYNRLYFDANANGDLTDDKPINTKDAESTGSRFRNIKVPLDVGGVKTEHVCWMRVVCAQIRKIPYTNVALYSGAVREGRIEHGGKKVRLILVDRNSNGRFDDSVSVRSQGSRVYLSMGDVFLVNPSAKAGDSRRGRMSRDYDFVGRTVRVGKHFYKMEVTPAGNRLTLKPAEVATGYVTNSSPTYRAVVYNDEHGPLIIRGTKDQKIPLPEGAWKLASYTIDASTGTRPTTINAAFSGNAQPLNVKKDNTIELPFGAPFRAVVTGGRSRDKKTFYLSLSIVGQGGERCTSFLIKGKRPPEPRFEVLDKEGKVVHSGKFEYG